MNELLRTLDDYAEIVNRMYEYGYIGNISEKVLGDARHFGSDHLIALIKANNVEPVIIKRERDCDNYPYQMEVNVGTHTLYCLLCQEKYDALIEEGILAKELLSDEA